MPLKILTPEERFTESIKTDLVLSTLLDKFSIDKDFIHEDELKGLRFYTSSAAYVKRDNTNNSLSKFNVVRNKDVSHLNISEVVCNLVAINLVNWLSSELSYVHDSDSCNIVVSFVKCVSTLTGEEWRMNDEDDLFLEFHFNKRQANTYLWNHIAFARDDSEDKHSWLVFENDKELSVDCISYRISQGDESYYQIH